MFQKASSSEYIMKGCEDKIIVYVKFHDLKELNSTIVFLNDQEESDQLKINWSNNKDFATLGDCILDKIRSLWNY